MSETWLDPDFPSELIHVQGYCLLRGAKGVGVLDQADY